MRTKITQQIYDRLAKEIKSSSLTTHELSEAFGFSNSTIRYIKASKNYEDYRKMRSVQPVQHINPTRTLAEEKPEAKDKQPEQMEIPVTSAKEKQPADPPVAPETKSEEPLYRAHFDNGEYRLFKAAQLHIAEIPGSADWLMRELKDGCIVNWARVLYIKKV